jgi:hypothetical protein
MANKVQTPVQNVQIMYSLFDHRGLLRFFFIPRLTTLKTTRENLKCQIFIQHFFKIVLYWCLDLICHNVGTPLKHNQYIFDIHIPFCHNLYLSNFLAIFNRICRFWNPLPCCLHVSVVWKFDIWDSSLVVFKSCQSRDKKNRNKPLWSNKGIHFLYIFHEDVNRM